MSDMQREAFERAMQDGCNGFFANVSLIRDSDDEYVDIEAFGGWLVWQAAIRHLTEQNEQRDKK